MDPKFFKALCDPTRIAILVRLAETCRPCTVSRISEWFALDISVVSRHLATLRDAGVLQARKQGKEVHYTVPYSRLTGFLRGLADAIEACCPTDEPDQGESE